MYIFKKNTYIYLYKYINIYIYIHICRRGAEDKIHKFIDNSSVTHGMAEHIVSPDVNEEFLDAVSNLSQKLNYLQLSTPGIQICIYIYVCIYMYVYMYLYVCIYILFRLTSMKSSWMLF
jgi:hypothetical protein